MNVELARSFFEEEMNTIPSYIVDAIESYLDRMKKFVYIEGRVCLLKRAITSKIRLHTNMLSDINVKEIYEEHKLLGTFFEAKTPQEAYVKDLEEQLRSSEKIKSEYLKLMLESRKKLNLWILPDSSKPLQDILTRTQNDLRTNVGKVNDNIFNNARLNHDLNRTLGFRWRSFFKDVSKSKDLISINETNSSSTGNTLMLASDETSRSSLSRSSFSMLSSSFETSSDATSSKNSLTLENQPVQKRIESDPRNENSNAHENQLQKEVDVQCPERARRYRKRRRVSKKGIRFATNAMTNAMTDETNAMIDKTNAMVNS